jgi:hypothetical protein
MAKTPRPSTTKFAFTKSKCVLSLYNIYIYASVYPSISASLALSLSLSIYSRISSRKASACHRTVFYIEHVVSIEVVGYGHVALPLCFPSPLALLYLPSKINK